MDVPAIANSNGVYACLDYTKSH